ncbi:GNAT family N-acetyltransferase [Pedobacter cryophilus]|uniref:GNAT family N-acetyltransferase n=1 Tax=Pedobacter cryophilus TaxID=2571271 RepID=A0A4V5NXR0_9SPHI|nr:GNAT family N-acetyltransferase [Pedobacter cryophilus]TKB99153.1 GNAT family N-acetyltransferase [Pedobacter cryophilus]
MINASYEDKYLIVDILTKSFDTNKSVNYIVKQDQKRIARIRSLMDYSFEMCYHYGDVYLTNDKKGCALVLYPHKKESSLKSILLDVKLILRCIGIENIGKAMKRESAIKQLQPKIPMYYLWFIGVDAKHQNNGIGSQLLEFVIADSEEKQLPVFLETSTLKNLPWYQKFGFKIYNELQLSYKLFFLKREFKV